MTTPPGPVPSHDDNQDAQLRALAAEIAKLGKLGFDPVTIRKGIVAAVSDQATPPTVSINISGDSETLVTQVRTLNNYTPLVGQTVLVAKQGSEIFLLGSIANINPTTAAGQPSVMDNGWLKATLTNGTHGGNANDVYYRRILDHGAWKVQWRGVWNPAGATFMIDTANALDADYRPTSYRAISCAREATDATTIRMDFNADGTVRWWQSVPNVASSGAGTSGSSAPGGSTGEANGTTQPLSSGVWNNPGGAGNHDHLIGHTHPDIFVNSHTHSTPSHSHTVSIANPSWISLNGVEYFL